MRRPRYGVRGRLATLLALTLGVALLAGCGAPAGPALVTATAPDGRGAIRPLPEPTGCTSTVRDGASLVRTLATVTPGSRVCVLGNIASRRLIVEHSGTGQAPISIVGDGRTLVRGITVDANYVTISGLNAVGAHAPGIELLGNHITLENSTVLSPRGDDGDGIRFWGNDIRITHNTIRDTVNLRAHADCMQTYATDPESPASQHVVIDHNRCERIDNMCLIAEGPNSLGGDGSHEGQSVDFTFADNYCENHASAATEIDDVQNVKIINNVILGKKEMGFSFQNEATGALVAGNTLAPDINYEVGMDNSCRPGYHGPEPGGGP